jgi:hypothetical protein
VPTVSEPGEVEGAWRVRMGVGLIQDVPMSDERRELIRRQSEREAERDRRDAELAAQLRADARIERVAELQRRGVQPRTVDETLAQASFAHDREDAAERRREREAAELLGNPKPRASVALLAAAKAEREARKPAAEVTPATEADVERKFASLKKWLWNVTGKRPSWGCRRPASSGRSTPSCVATPLD